MRMAQGVAQLPRRRTAGLLPFALVGVLPGFLCGFLGHNLLSVRAAYRMLVPGQTLVGAALLAPKLLEVGLPLPQQLRRQQWHPISPCSAS